MENRICLNSSSSTTKCALEKETNIEAMDGESEVKAGRGLYGEAMDRESEAERGLYGKSLWK